MPKLELKTEGDHHIVITRTFAAPQQAVYRAHTEPELIKQWMLGPPGWTMPVCINDARAGGTFRYAWSNGKGGDFFITGEFIALLPFSRIEHIERMHLPDPTPDSHVVTTFEPIRTGTRMTVRMTLPDAAARAAMLNTGMEHGMEASYARLETMCAHEHLAVSHDLVHLHATPTIIHTEPKLTATIRLNIPSAEMMKAFGPAVQEVASVLASQGISPVGSAFAHHFRMAPGRFDFEVGFVTPTAVKPAGRVQPSHWSGGRCVHAIYFGPYERLPMAWAEFASWMKSNAVIQADDLYEQYVTGPHISPDPTQWRTELYKPMRE